MDSVGSVQFQIVLCSSLYLSSRSIGPFQYLVNVNYRVLIYCTCHFQSCSLFFVYFGFLLLQLSSEYNFCRDTRGVKVVAYLGSLVQLCCGEGGILQTNIAGVCVGWREIRLLTLMGHTGLIPAHSGMWFPGVHFSVSRLPCRGIVQSGPCLLCTSQV